MLGVMGCAASEQFDFRTRVVWVALDAVLTRAERSSGQPSRAALPSRGAACISVARSVETVTLAA